MQLRNNKSRYGAITQSLHWLSALLVVLAWTLGVLGDELPKGGLRELGNLVHMSAGEAIVALLLLRVVWRLIDPPPRPIAAEGAPYFDLVAKFMHFALYALLILVPVSGVLTAFTGGEALQVFGLFEIPSPWLRDKQFEETASEIHELLAHTLIALAALHAIAALAHHFYKKDATLSRMLPWA